MLRWNLANKVWSIVIIVMGFGVLASFLGISSLTQSRDASVQRIGEQLTAGHQLRLKALIETNANVIADAIKGQPADQIDAIIQKLVSNAWFKTTFEEEQAQGYFFVYDYKANCIAHAAKPDMAGDSLWDTQDANGVYLVREMSRTAQEGGGFVEYLWTRPGKDTPDPKLTYTMTIPGTDYFIGTGVYTDDIEQGQADIAKNLNSITSSAIFRGGLIAGLYLAVIVIPLTFWIIRGSIQKPLRKLADRFRDIAEGEGDLTKRINYNNKDEIGEVTGYFDRFMDKLHDTITQISSTTNDVAGSAGEIASNSQEITRQAHDQTQQLTQISTAVEEMSSSVIEVARKSSDANNNAEQAGERAREGGEIVEQTVEGITSIAEIVREAAAAVGHLGERSEAIGEVIEVINDIADQTNLLALNAAIEAARAGEHGRGFAVVADEVRKLADRTTKATEEIADSIKTIQSETQTVVARIETGTTKVDEGVQLAEKAGASLGSIVDGSQEVARMIQSIAAAAEEQSSAATEISHSLDSISNSTRSSSEGAAQASQAASDLAQQSEKLRSMVAQFKIAA